MRRRAAPDQGPASQPCVSFAALAGFAEAVLGEVLLKVASVQALQLEVGYIFNPRHAGQGYAAEAVQAMLGWGFDGLGAHRIFARLDALNTASVKVVERLGLRREAHLRQNDRFNGVWGDEYVYALLRAEWAARTPGVKHTLLRWRAAALARAGTKKPGTWPGCGDRRAGPLRA